MCEKMHSDLLVCLNNIYNTDQHQTQLGQNIFEVVFESLTLEISSN